MNELESKLYHFLLKVLKSQYLRVLKNFDQIIKKLRHLKIFENCN